MKRRLKKIFTVLLCTLFLINAIMGSYATITVSAATENEMWDAVSELIDASDTLVQVLAKYGISPEDLKSLTLQNGSEAFFDVTIGKAYEKIAVPETHVVDEIAYENNYRPIFEKQLKVISRAVDENRSRGFTRKNYSIEEDVQFMFMSHYIDGNQGQSMYFSEYGYQSFNMADWLTDDDRSAYVKLLNNIDIGHTLDSAGKIIESVDSAKNFKEGFNHFLNFTNNIIETYEVLDFFITNTASQTAEFIPDSQIIDYSQFIAIASEELQYSDTITEFQERYFGRLSLDFDYLPSFHIDSIATVMSAMVTAENLSVGGLVMTFAYTTLYLAADSFRLLSTTSLALTRNFRIAERVNDYMEYLGYW